ncbi:MAG: prolyl oligopeptidase family serine peptidase [Steroidobacteraceae bacterium]
MRQAILIVLLTLSGSPALAYQPADLMRPGIIHGAAISPSGRYIAVGIGNSVGITDSIAILDTQREASDRLMRRIPLATPKAERIVTHLTWASDGYLLAIMNYADKEPVTGRVAQAALHSIHAEGNGEIKPYDALQRPLHFTEDGRPDSRFLYLTSGPFVSGLLGPRPYEIELATGSVRLLAEPDRLTMGWRVRDGRAVVKFNEGKMGEVANIYASLTEGEDWKLVNSLRYPEDRRNHLELIGEAESPLVEYLRKTPKGGDVDGIHLRDLWSNQLTARVFELPGHDVLSAQIRQRKFVSATYLDDTLRMRFADDELQRHYTAIGKYFGADISIRATLSSTLAGAWLLHVSGPQNPGEYHFYDPARRHIELIGIERPWLEAGKLAPSTPLIVAARDGTQLRAYVTCPAGGGPEKRPLVVMPPAGPWEYAYLHYAPYAQAFAVEGWCTVIPNVRGTYGRGRAFQAMGFGQWNGHAADDVADTVQTLVMNGIADPARVAGYGELLGSTMLMAVEARQPGKLKAIVAYAPVLDGDNLLYGLKTPWGRSLLIYEDWSLWLGLLGKGSTLRKQLFQIRVAMFLIHPTFGVAAPIEDTQALAKQLVKAGLPPKTRYPDFREAASRSDREKVEVLESVVAFLRQHLED